jgi:peptide/nickel transport system substrate-binding protein
MFNNYEQNHERATELLEEVGFEKNNGTWEGEIEGESLDVTIFSPPFWTNMAQTVTNQLQQFGIQAELQTEDQTSVWGSLAPNSEFRAMMWIWGNGGHPFNAWSSTDTGLRQYDSHGRYPKELTVPAMPGGNGEMTVNVADHLDQMTQVGDEEAAELITELAWAFNQDPLFMPVHEWTEIFWFDREKWNFPENSHPDMNVHRPYVWPAKTGRMSAETQ